MALSIVKSPNGHILNKSGFTAIVSNSLGNARFTKNNHGLSTGDDGYVYSDRESYNGFWRVTVVDSNIFTLSEYDGANPLLFYNDATVVFYRTDVHHQWNCVHLPIVYKLKSTLWPLNSADSLRSVSSFSNYNGYTYLNLSGDLKTTGNASALEQIIIRGTSDVNNASSLNGVYKILNWFSDTNIVINLIYSSSNNFSGGTVQYYYLNYHARIKIRTGFNFSHYWSSQKPEEVVTEIKAIPDADGIVTININEFLKSKIDILKNNQNLNTLPSDLNSWIEFHIEYAESYDDSNMYTVSEFVSAYTEDSTVYYAINAKLPFKGRYIGMMSEYISGNTADSRQKFLTNFERPVLFAGLPYTISFILNTLNRSYIKRELYISNVLQATYYDYFDFDNGVYRHLIQQSGWAEDRIDITLFNEISAIQLSETLTIDVNSDCYNQSIYMVWLNNLGGYDYWLFTARKTYSIDILESKRQTKNIFVDWSDSYGEFADTIERQTMRRARNVIEVNSQNLTLSQLEVIKNIRMSALVQIQDGQYTRRTVLVDNRTFKIRTDEDDLFSISFSIEYTDEIPVQSL